MVYLGQKVVWEKWRVDPTFDESVDTLKNIIGATIMESDMDSENLEWNYYLTQLFHSLVYAQRT